jgi:hypothetical protein
MTAGTRESDEREVLERELALLQPAVRQDGERLLAYLHEDFREFGASGTVWERSTIAAAAAGAQEPITASALHACRLGPGSMLVTYRTSAGGRHALRSSIWLRDPQRGWLLLFHQGTPSA